MTILLMVAAILFLIAGNWKTTASERGSQETDDAYVRADVTPLSTWSRSCFESLAFGGRIIHELYRAREGNLRR